MLEQDVHMQKTSAIELKVLLLLCSHLYREGIRTLLLEGSKFPVSFTVHSRETVGEIRPDIILSDARNMDQALFSLYPEAKIVVVDDGFSPDEIRALCSLYRVHGVISSHSGGESLRSALERIHCGGCWLEHEIILRLLGKASENPTDGRNPVASEREREVIRYVCAGHSNKEIASMLSLSEHTVKAHLNSVYRKFCIAGRVELARFFSKNIS